MIPLGNENPTLRPPVVTWGLLAMLAGVWAFVQGFGFDTRVLAASVCNWGLVPGELTQRAALGVAVPIAEGLACVVDREPNNVLTPLTSMFLHGGWAHLLGNGLFLWVFGNNIEDSMGRLRFLAFYLVCGLCAAAAQTLVHPASPVPMVGASGAISGVLGAYLVLYPLVRVRMLFWFFLFVRVIPIPAWIVLIWWFVLQVLAGLPELTAVNPEVSTGTAVFAHIGGFVAGVVLVKLFVDPRLQEQRALLWARTAPER